MSSDIWQMKVEKWCIEFDIPHRYLPEILSNPKVTPMIRGYALEYQVLMLLNQLLPIDDWAVTKPVINAQAGLHDNDLLVEHLPSKKKIRVECKLAKKGSFKFRSNEAQCEVKCMRSRTLGEGVLPARAKQLGVRKDHLRAHADNYTSKEFDFVISALSNAFYETEESTLEYVWGPSADAEKFLKTYDPDPRKSTKEIATGYFLLARSSELTPKSQQMSCRRRACRKGMDCEFIPNNPRVDFSEIDSRPEPPWYEISRVKDCFESFVRTAI